MSFLNSNQSSSNDGPSSSHARNQESSGGRAGRGGHHWRGGGWGRGASRRGLQGAPEGMGRDSNGNGPGLGDTQESFGGQAGRGHHWRGGGRGRGAVRRGFQGSSEGISCDSGGDGQGLGSNERGGRGWGGNRGRGPGRGRGGGNALGQQNTPRPTHFLALPLNHHSTLRTRVGNFQAALLDHDPPITGLDSSIVIDPRRLHLTLGVMALENPSDGNVHADSASSPPRKTPETALALLSSLKPRISQLLNEPDTHFGTQHGGGVKVPLEVLDVFPPGATTGASVVFLGPDMTGIDDRPSRSKSTSSKSSMIDQKTKEKFQWKEQLWTVANFVHQEFKKAGYITEQRPLKLHCTILNTSHRKPRRRIPLSYDDILNSPARSLIQEKAVVSASGSKATLELSHETLSTGVDLSASPAAAGPSKRSTRGSVPLPVNLGVYDVRDVQLWVMGSHGPNNEYVSLGGIKLE